MRTTKAILLVCFVLAADLEQFLDAAPTNGKVSGTKIIQQEPTREEPTREEPTTTVTTLATDKPEVQAEADLAASPEIYSLYKNLMKAYGKQLLENAMHKFFDIA